MNTKFQQGMADIFEVDLVDVKEDFDLEDAGWDSLAIVSTIALIDETFDKVVDTEKLAECVTIGDILLLVQTGEQ